MIDTKFYPSVGFNKLEENINHILTLEGEKKVYHGCTSESKEAGDKFYSPDKWTYVGSGYTWYYNGKEQKGRELIHCYTRNDLTQKENE